MVQLSFLRKHQERCAICGMQFVPLSVEFSYVNPDESQRLTLSFLVCSMECLKEADKRMKELKRAARKSDQWG